MKMQVLMVVIASFLLQTAVGQEYFTLQDYATVTCGGPITSTSIYTRDECIRTATDSSVYYTINSQVITKTSYSDGVCGTFTSNTTFGNIGSCTHDGYTSSMFATGKTTPAIPYALFSVFTASDCAFEGNRYAVLLSLCVWGGTYSTETVTSGSGINMKKYTDQHCDDSWSTTHYEVGECLPQDEYYKLLEIYTSLCFVATAAFGSSYHPVVLELKEFRDTVLEKSALGRIAIQLYYACGPILAEMVQQSEIGRTVARMAITSMLPLIRHPWGVLGSLLALLPMFILIL